MNAVEQMLSDTATYLEQLIQQRGLADEIRALTSNDQSPTIVRILQEPIGNEDLEKLMVVRSRYQGIRSAASRPLAMVDDSMPSNRRDSSRLR